jgi:hypothetical protein
MNVTAKRFGQSEVNERRGVRVDGELIIVSRITRPHRTRSLVLCRLERTGELRYIEARDLISI